MIHPTSFSVFESLAKIGHERRRIYGTKKKADIQL